MNKARIEYIPRETVEKVGLSWTNLDVALNWRCPFCRSLMILNKPLYQLECWSCGKYVGRLPERYYYILNGKPLPTKKTKTGKHQRETQCSQMCTTYTIKGGDEND